MIENLKFNNKKLAVILGVTSLSLVTGCGKKNNEKSLYDVIYSNRDRSCIYSVVDINKVVEIDKLKNYMNLSDRLAQVKLNRFSITDCDEELLSVFDINVLLSAYLDEISDRKRYKFIPFHENNLSDEELAILEYKLVIQEGLVNRYISEGLGILDDVTYSIALGVKKDVTGKNVKNLPIVFEEADTNEKDNYINIGDGCVLTKNTDFAKLLKFYYQSYLDESKRDSYDRKRNDRNREFIDFMMRVSNNKHKIEDGIIKEKRRKN